MRVAAKGDGVTESGRHVPRAAPGDRIAANGTLVPGPHHAVPPCRHFGTCGACQLQHLDDATLTQFVADRVANAAAGQELNPGSIRPPHLSPPRSRRRATMHAQRVNGRIVLGFHEGGSHRIFDMHECHVLAPALFALVAPLRRVLAAQPGRLAVEIEMTLTSQGVELGLKGLKVEGLAATEAMLDFARDQSLARLTLDQGFGPETVWEPEPVRSISAASKCRSRPAASSRRRPTARPR